MRVFLAGATGVIGRRLVPLLISQGHHVTGITRTSDGAARLRAQGADAAVVDVFDAAALTVAVGSAAPDVVMHQLTDLSGGSSADNATMRKIGTRNLVDAARAAQVQRIVAQSVAWAYSAGEEPAVEETPLDLGAKQPRLTTIEGVAALEQAVRELPQWVVLRYGALYGPGTWYAPGELMADKAARGELVSDGDVTSFVHVRDAVVAATEALAWPSGVVNICDDEPAAGHEWVPAFCAAVGAPAPRRDNDADRHPWARGASNHYARKHLSWSPAYASWRDGFTAG